MPLTCYQPTVIHALRPVYWAFLNMLHFFLFLVLSETNSNCLILFSLFQEYKFSLLMPWMPPRLEGLKKLFFLVPHEVPCSLLIVFTKKMRLLRPHGGTSLTVSTFSSFFIPWWHRFALLRHGQVLLLGLTSLHHPKLTGLSTLIFINRGPF